MKVRTSVMLSEDLLQAISLEVKPVNRSHNEGLRVALALER